MSIIIGKLSLNNWFEDGDGFVLRTVEVPLPQFCYIYDGNALT